MTNPTAQPKRKNKPGAGRPKLLPANEEGKTRTLYLTDEEYEHIKQLVQLWREQAKPPH